MVGVPDNKDKVWVIRQLIIFVKRKTGSIQKLAEISQSAFVTQHNVMEMALPMDWEIISPKYSAA